MLTLAAERLIQIPKQKDDRLLIVVKSLSKVVRPRPVRLEAQVDVGGWC